MNHKPIVQEFVPQADKHLYCALWEDREPLATYQHKQLRQSSWVRDGSVYRVSAYSPDVEEVAYDLLSHLDWHGLVCIEFLKDEDTGEWKFLEIKSLSEAVRVGVDCPYYWPRARGRSEPIDDGYETGIAVTSRTAKLHTS